MDGFPPYANLVYDAATMSWVRMTQPLVDSLTSNLYLAVDQVETLLASIKDQQTTSSTTSVQRTRISGTETHIPGSPLIDAHIHNVSGHNAVLVTFPAPVNDAFGRVRVSDPISVFDYQQEYNQHPYIMEASTASGGTAVHSTSSASTLLTAGATSGSLAILQSRQYHRYQPGKSCFVAMTFNFGTGSSGIRQRTGYFDGSNGIFVELDGTSLYLVLRKNGVDNAVLSTLWNVDPFDGSGPSGITLDKTKAQIFVADLQWLGVGRVRAGFDIDGEILIAHEFFHANDNTGVYMRTANLPIRWEVSRYSTASATTSSMEAICGVILSEGGYEQDRGFPFSAVATTGRTVAARRAILSIRPKATFNGLTTRGFIFPEETEAIATGNNVITLVEVVYNPTFTGTPTWASADAESQVEYSVHGDAGAGAFTGGVVVHSFLLAATQQSRAAFPQALFTKLALTLDIAGLNPRALSVVGTDVVGTATMYATIGWVEMR